MMKKIISMLAVMALMVMLLPSCTIVDVTEVGTLNGESLLLEEYTNYFSSALAEEYGELTEEQKTLVKSENPDSDAEGMVENFWELQVVEEETGATITIEDRAKATAMDNFIEYTMKLQKVKELALTLDQADLDEIDSNIEYYNQMYMQYYGMNFVEYLELSGISYDEYMEIEKEGKLISKMEEKITAEHAPTDEELRAAFDKDYVHVKHILIKAVPSEDGTYSDEAMADAKTKAQSVIDALNGGADFDATLAAYTEDVDAEGNPNSPNGYSFNKENNSMVKPFSDEASALEIGAYSAEPVEVTMDQSGSYAGYHIVYRLELDDAGFEENRSTLETEAKDAFVEKSVDEWISASDLQKNEKRISKLDAKDYYNTQE